MNQIGEVGLSVRGGATKEILRELLVKRQIKEGNADNNFVVPKQNEQTHTMCANTDTRRAPQRVLGEENRTKKTATAAATTTKTKLG